MPDPKLRVMIVDENDERVDLLTEPLAAAGYQLAARVTPDQDLFAEVLAARPDIIIVDMGSPSRDTLEQMRCINRDHPKPIVMFANDDNSETIRMAVQAGVSAYIVDGLDHHRVKPILDVAIARFQEFQSLRQELEETKVNLEERKLIDRAKGLLMRQRGWTEPEAYKALRKMAMDKNLRIAQVAENLIAAFDLMGVAEVTTRGTGTR